MNIYFDCIGHLDCVCVTVWDHLTLFIAVVLTAPLLVLPFFVPCCHCVSSVGYLLTMLRQHSCLKRASRSHAKTGFYDLGLAFGGLESLWGALGGLCGLIWDLKEALISYILPRKCFLQNGALV